MLRRRTALDSWIWEPDLTMARLPRLEISLSTSFGTCSHCVLPSNVWNCQASVGADALLV